MGKGFLEVHLFLGDMVMAVGGMEVLVKDTRGRTIHKLTSDEHGVTERVPLDAPDKQDGANQQIRLPYFSVYDVEVPAANGYKKVIVHSVQIFDEQTSILPVQIQPAIEGDTADENTIDIYIPLEHGADMPRGGMLTQDANYNIPRVGITQRPSANEVMIPEYITVHLGSPNAVARNVRVPFADYIKNVASSEIFPDWPVASLYANIYAQISFALNRIHTVWYRSRGMDFDITNSTAFDQFFVEGRNIFENISQIVDGIFNVFLRRQGRREPFFAQYCDGRQTTCDGMSQWGSRDLALRGYTTEQILKYYYPDDLRIVESTNFSNRIGTFNGVSLREGMSGNDVLTMQLYLNRISGNFFIPPINNPDGIFGSATKASVIEFQKINNLVPDGIIGKATWYRITQIYVGVMQLAELTSEGERIDIGAAPPTSTISLGDRGEDVVELQFILSIVAEFFPAIPFIVRNGVFREETKRAVVEFQKEFGLTPDGIVGPSTWNKLYDVFYSVSGSVEVPPEPEEPQFPGTPLAVGSTGSNVLFMQNRLNAIAQRYPSIPTIVADGIFGAATQAATRAFQQQFGLTVDGIIGQITWNRINEVYNNLLAPSTPQFPGTPLRIGSRGSDVQFMQSHLNSIAKVFPLIPSITVDGIFGARTQAAVIAFQSLFGLTQDGVIGQNTWDKIVSVYEGLPDVAAPVFPGTSLRVGSRGNDVIIMQKYLNTIAQSYPSIPSIVADGVFGENTRLAVVAFQNQFGLTPDGIIGQNTWNTIVSVFNMLTTNVGTANVESDDAVPVSTSSSLNAGMFGGHGFKKHLLIAVAVILMSRWK